MEGSAGKRYWRCRWFSGVLFVRRGGDRVGRFWKLATAAPSSCCSLSPIREMNGEKQRTATPLSGTDAKQELRREYAKKMYAARRARTTPFERRAMVSWTHGVRAAPLSPQQQELVLRHLPYARYRAIRWSRSLRAPFDECLEHAQYALVVTAAVYVPERKTDFTFLFDIVLRGILLREVAGWYPKPVSIVPDYRQVCQIANDFKRCRQAAEQIARKMRWRDLQAVAEKFIAMAPPKKIERRKANWLVVKRWLYGESMADLAKELAISRAGVHLRIQTFVAAMVRVGRIDATWLE